MAYGRKMYDLKNLDLDDPGLSVEDAKKYLQLALEEEERLKNKVDALRAEKKDRDLAKYERRSEEVKKKSKGLLRKLRK